MRRSIVALAALSLGPPAGMSAPVVSRTPSPASWFFLRGAVLFNGTGDPPRPAMDMLVAGERIERVFADSSLDPRLLDSVNFVDLRGRFVIPGLIDAHVHLATPPNRRQAEAVLRRDSYGGVTAVRDMADDLRAVGELARASLVGEIAAPDIFYAAVMAGPKFFRDSRTAQVSTGGVLGHVPRMQAVRDDTDVPMAVAWTRGTYASGLKLYADFTPDMVRRITAEAHHQRLPVWAHATLYPAKPSDVVAAGGDVVSHACLLIRETEAHVPTLGEPRLPVSLDQFRRGDAPALNRLFSEMARRGTILDATLWTYSDATAGSTTMPALPAGSCDDIVGPSITGQAFRAGVLVAAGTDNVAEWSDQWPELFQELLALQRKARMPSSPVLLAATSIGARATNQERDMGTIAPGKLANMVVLTRDPLADLENLRTVQLVVKRGRLFERSAYTPLDAGDITDR